MNYNEKLFDQFRLLNDTFAALINQISEGNFEGDYAPLQAIFEPLIERNEQLIAEICKINKETD